MKRSGMIAKALDGTQTETVFYGQDTNLGKFLTKTDMVNGRVREASIDGDIIVGVSMFMQGNIDIVEGNSKKFLVGDTGTSMTNGVIWMIAKGTITEGDKIESTPGGNPQKVDGTGIEVNAIAESSATDGQEVAIKVNI